MSFKSILCYHLNLILSILLLLSCSFGICSASDELGSADTFTFSSFSYPETTLRPFDLRYIRVDLPLWFSAVSIALNSDVDLDIAIVERVPESILPLICFRDGSPPLPDASNTSLKDSVISGINGLLDVEQCFPMQKNITMKFTNEQISAGAWYIGLFNGIGATRTQSKMIIRGPEYSFSANITVEACTNSMMLGEFCNSTFYPLLCTASDVYNAVEATVKQPMMENVVTCKNNIETFCVQERVPKFFSLDIMNMAEAFTIMAANVRFNITTSNITSHANDVKLMCFACHGAMPSVTSHDYSIDITKCPLVIRSALIGRWYISILPVNITKKLGEAQDGDVRVCYAIESQVIQCPLGKAGPNCTMSSYILQE